MRKWSIVFVLLFAQIPRNTFASEVELRIPEFSTIFFNIFGISVPGTAILLGGIVVALLGMAFGLYEFLKTKRLPSHPSMLDVSSLIYET